MGFAEKRKCKVVDEFSGVTSESASVDSEDSQNEDLLDEDCNEVNPERKAVLSLLKRFRESRRSHGVSKPSYQIAKKLRLKGKWLNRGANIIGTVPGVNVGDKFVFRAELCMIGLHTPFQAGISFVNGAYNKWGIHVANSIVLSDDCSYDDDDRGDNFVYHGAGGWNRSKDFKPSNQDLVRGNLGLVNAYKLQVPIRVIRGVRVSSTGKLYRYDGLYRVTQYWQEKSPCGAKVYKFFFLRCTGQQPSLFTKEEWIMVLKQHMACT